MSKQQTNKTVKEKLVKLIDGILYRVFSPVARSIINNEKALARISREVSYEKIVEIIKDLHGLTSIAEHICVHELADEFTASEIAECMEISDEEVAKHVEVDPEDVAKYVEVDRDAIAEHVIATTDVEKDIVQRVSENFDPSKVEDRLFDYVRDNLSVSVELD